MLVKCDIEVNNRLTPTAFAHSHTRASRGAVCLCRKGEDPVKCKKKNFNVIIYTSKHKNGFNYRVRFCVYIGNLSHGCICMFESFANNFCKFYHIIIDTIQYSIYG